MEILTVPHPALKRRCESSVVVTVHAVSEMLRLMERNGGIGLAAPQVGIDARFFVTGWGEIFINPDIVAVSETMFPSREGCLSIPGKQFIVMRHKWVRLRNDRRKHDGIKGAVIQHETDHLNGILISDVGKEVTAESSEEIKGVRQYIRGGRVPSPSVEAA